MNKKTIMATFAFGLILVVSSSVGLILQARQDRVQVNDTSKPNTSAAVTIEPEHDLTKMGTPTTVTGVIACLSSPGTNARAASCAMGLTQDDGTTYALNAQDPFLIANLPTGTRVQISGRINQVPSPYDIAGTIVVQAVNRQ